MRHSTARGDCRLRRQGAVVAATGAGLVAAGGATWLLIRRQLVEEKITVETDAPHFAGAQVAGPLTAYFQAEAIGRHALEASGGKVYAELKSGDPGRQTVLTGSFLRASLFTSVMAFGVAALTAGIGVVLVVIGTALGRTARSHGPAI